MRLAQNAAGRTLERFCIATGAAPSFVKSVQASANILTAQPMNVVHVAEQKSTKTKIQSL